MTNQELRAEVLRAHYELADGDPFQSVMRTDVAAKLNIADYNDNKLIAAVTYLASKGYFAHSTNVTENLSTQGIDEYEQGFPTLLPQKPSTSQSGSGYVPSEIEEKLLRAIHERDKTRHNKKHTDRDVINTAHNANLDISKDDFEAAFTILCSKRYFTKEVSRVTAAQQKAMFTSLDPKTLHGSSTTYYSLSGDALLYLAGRHNVSSTSSATPAVTVFDNTAIYRARRALETLFEGAKQHIKVEDNYIGRRTLDLLLSAKNVPIQIITKSKKEANFANALVDFQRDYGGTIDIKDEDNRFHGRFIIVDGQTYIVDHSLKDFAEKPSAIIKVEVPEANRQYIKFFDDTW